jgi:hypothetical protein
MKLPLTLFATSFTIVVAAGLVQLDAGPEADGPLRKPALHTITVGDHQLEVSVDRERVPTGEAVKLAIVARHGGGAGDKLRVAVLEQMGSPMSRSMPPPREVFHQDVVVGKDGALTVPLTLTTSAGRLAAVTEAKAATKVDPLLTAGRATQLTIVVSGRGDDAGSAGRADHVASIDNVGSVETSADEAAYLPVFAYEPEAYRLEIEPIAAGEPGTPVDVAVKVTSLAKAPLRKLTVGASSAIATIDEPATIETLAPGEVRTIHLRGTRVAPPADAASLLVNAYGYAEYGGTAGAWASLAVDGTLLARASEMSDPMLLGL